ncbi:hypothetical protein QQF64_028280 [Cirrhinus molitorella]|uniref:Uncharacterized protein n=1 Tax=Cirrhinus molitorella TaxID=172907 RepID=A0ABR3N653_9TELE
MLIRPGKCCVDAANGPPPAAASRSTCHAAAAGSGARSSVDMCSSNIPSTALINHHYPDTQLRQLDLPARTQRFLTTLLQEKLYTTAIFDGCLCYL